MTVTCTGAGQIVQQLESWARVPRRGAGDKV